MPSQIIQALKTFILITASINEHQINGEFTFWEDGEELKIPIVNANYVVVPKPEAATISADKMNVVYRGVRNPMTSPLIYSVN